AARAHGAHREDVGAGLEAAVALRRAACVEAAAVVRSLEPALEALGAADRLEAQTRAVALDGRARDPRVRGAGVREQDVELAAPEAVEAGVHDQRRAPAD